MNYFLDKSNFGKKSLYLRLISSPLNFNTLDHEQSLFSLRDSLVSREKTNKRADEREIASGVQM